MIGLNARESQIMNGWHVIFALLMGFSLAAVCGLRAFLPLLVISLGVRSGLVTASDGFAWMGSNTALICFGFATLLEILADKIPMVDHALDAAGVFVRPVAGAVAASSLIRGFDPLMTVVVGIIIGSSVAGVVHTLKGSLRLLSTATTGGIANPVLSIIEDVTATVTSVISVFLPYLAAGAVIFLLFVAANKVGRKLKSGKTGLGKTSAPAEAEAESG
jgi:uncharacterized membrane protein